MRGSTMTGKAADFIDEMLPMYASEEALAEIGIHRERTRRAAFDGPVVNEVRFLRPHREVDVTGYGDAYRQTLIVSPGLDATVTGSKRETDLFALLLVHQGKLMQLAQEERANAEKAKRIRAREGDIAERNTALLAMWDKLGKKRRANLAASDPKVAALCAELEEEREREARMDAEGFDW